MTPWRLPISNLRSLECEGLPSLSLAAETRRQAQAVLKSGSKLPHSKARRGMTLVELLVVVGIMLVVVVMMVPRLPAMMTRSKVREAARVLQLYFSSARVQAMTSGRSCGVMIEPLAIENGCAMTLSQVETPPPYGGDSCSSTATVKNNGDATVYHHTLTCDKHSAPRGRSYPVGLSRLLAASLS